MQTAAGRTALTLGGAKVDTIVILENETVERISLKNAHRSYLLLEEGQKADTRMIEQHAGGGGMNTAVSFARLGFRTAIIAKVGRDQKAEMLRSTLVREKIDASFVRDTDRLGTGSSVLVLAHERNAAVFTYRGSNGLLEPVDLVPAAFARDLVYVAGLSNASADHFPAIVDLARRNGAFVAANPGARQLSTRSDEIWKTIGKLSLLSLNSDEMALMLPRLVAESGSIATAPAPSGGQMPWLLGRGLVKDSLHLGLLDAMRVLIEAGVGVVVVTDGARGAYAASKGRMIFCPALEGNVQGTTGAGDAFSSTFAASMALGASLEEALRRATLNAKSVVEVVDAQSGLLQAAALDSALELHGHEMKLCEWSL